MAGNRMRRRPRRVLAGVLMGTLLLHVRFAAASGPEVGRPAAGVAQPAAGMAANAASMAATDYVFLFKWGAQAPVGTFNHPYGVAVASGGTVYVADRDNHRIQRFGSTGVFVAVWGTMGSGDGQFGSPSGVAVASDGTVYVADTGNRRIQRFTSTGAYLGKWGSEGSGGGQFKDPRGVAVA